MSFFSSLFINLLYAFDFFGPPPPPDFSKIIKKLGEIKVGSYVLPTSEEKEAERRKEIACHGLFFVTPESDLGAILFVYWNNLRDWVGSRHKDWPDW